MSTEFICMNMEICLLNKSRLTSCLFNALRFHWLPSQHQRTGFWVDGQRQWQRSAVLHQDLHRSSKKSKICYTAAFTSWLCTLVYFMAAVFMRVFHRVLVRSLPVFWSAPVWICSTRPPCLPVVFTHFSVMYTQCFYSLIIFCHLRLSTFLTDVSH